MNELVKLMDNEHIDVAYPELDRHNRYEKVDKKAVQNKLRTTEQLNKIQKELDGCDFEKRFAWIMDVKSKADGLYYEKKFEEALKEYLQALMGLNYEGLDETHKQKLDTEGKLKILMNMALCSYNMQQYAKANKFLEQAENVHHEPKIYYIYALSMFKQQNYEAALKMINKAMHEAEGKYTEDVVKGYSELRLRISRSLKGVTEKEKQLYGKLMSSDIYVS